MSKHLDIVWTNQFKKDYKLAMNTQRFIWKVRKCTRYKCRVHFFMCAQYGRTLMLDEAE